ncbi:hypothetical protein Sros01_68160 [Streptomyces roseochromogenus]|nr:hypothetical protein Sros01_68160 [Streptomyces roseochromogenus]
MCAIGWGAAGVTLCGLVAVRPNPRAGGIRLFGGLSIRLLARVPLLAVRVRAELGGLRHVRTGLGRAVCRPTPGTVFSSAAPSLYLLNNTLWCCEREPSPG